MNKISQQECTIKNKRITTIEEIMKNQSRGSFMNENFRKNPEIVPVKESVKGPQNMRMDHRLQTSFQQYSPSRSAIVNHPDFSTPLSKFEYLQEPNLSKTVRKQIQDNKKLNHEHLIDINNIRKMSECQQNKIHNIEQQLGFLKNNFSSWCQMKDNQQIEDSSKSIYVRQLERMLQKKDEEILCRQSQICRLQSQKSGSNRNYNQHNNVDRLKEQINRLKDAENQLVEMNLQLGEDIEYYKSVIQELKEENDKLKNKFQSNNQNSELTSTIVMKNSKIQHLTQSIQMKQDQLKKKNNLISELQGKKQANENMMRKCNQQKEQLKLESYRLSEIITNFKLQISEKNHKFISLGETLSKSQKQINQLLISVQKYPELVNNLNDKYSQLSKELSLEKECRIQLFKQLSSQDKSIMNFLLKIQGYNNVLCQKLNQSKKLLQKYKSQNQEIKQFIQTQLTDREDDNCYEKFSEQLIADKITNQIGLVQKILEKQISKQIFYFLSTQLKQMKIPDSVSHKQIERISKFTINFIKNMRENLQIQNDPEIKDRRNSSIGSQYRT